MTIDEIINRIGYFRSKANLSARELSLRIDKNASYINHLESKEFNIMLSVLLDIIEALDISNEEFFAKDYRNYKENKEIAETFKNLTPENKKIILDLMKNLK